MMTRWLTCLVFLPWLSSHGDTAFNLGFSTAPAGSEIILPLSITSIDEPVGFQCEIRYSGDGVTMKPVTAGPALNDHRVSSKTLAPDRQRVVVFSPTDKTLNDDVAVRIPFEVEAGAANAALTISLLDVVVAGQDGTDIVPDDALPGLLTISDGGPGGSEISVTSVTIGLDGSFSFSLNDTGDTRFRVEASSDLQTWESLGEFDAQGGRLEFVDQAAAQGGERYFRAVKLN